MESPGTEQALPVAVTRAVAYADIFDYPLTRAELHRYLYAFQVSRPELDAWISRGGNGAAAALELAGTYVVLRGRGDLVPLRHRREAIAHRLWADARRLTARLARAPFVRMIAVTGALAVDNVGEHDDIDLLIVSQARRVWLCRALAAMLARLLRRHGVVVCVNYVISESALGISPADFFSARELAQMIPVAGSEVYDAMRAANRWLDDLLPNAGGPPREMGSAPCRQSRVGRVVEWLLGGRLGGFLEACERRRKVARMRREYPHAREAFWSLDVYKGHFSGHRERIRIAYAQRLGRLNLGIGEGTQPPLIAAPPALQEPLAPQPLPPGEPTRAP
ncbi:MAG: hypothetical protein HYV63_15495 [Candidatus Schekmanbacteria bacterium]|nr:hypothetical protein [Candidatus Schekmanbacteria bacterium]